MGKRREGDTQHSPSTEERAAAVARRLLRNENPRVREAQRALREEKPQR